MTPEEQQKAIDRLARAIEVAFNSPGRLFWRGILWGIARGLGATLGLGIVLGASYYFLRLTGLDATFGSALKSIEELSKSVNALRQ